MQTKWRKHAVNIALILLAIVALYWRVFFLGETIIDVNTLNNQLPWGYGATQQVNHPYNRRDPTDMYLTREYFIVSAYRDGELPLWNPYTFAGHPIYADGVTRIFSPSLLFYTFLDLPLGYSVARLVELLLGAIFMYWFLITIGVSARAALMGALVFELSAHSLFHLTGLGWWGGLMWMPLILLFVDRSITLDSFSQAIIAGILIALQFFSAYMPNQIYYLGAVVLYYLVFGWRAQRAKATGAKNPGRIRLVAKLAVTLAVGLALAATQWLPVLELLGYSNRRIVPTETSFIYLPPWYLLTLIFPDLFGQAYDPKMVTLFTALNVSHDHSLYLSLAALLPLGFLLHWVRGNRRQANAQKRRLGGLPGQPEAAAKSDGVANPVADRLEAEALTTSTGWPRVSALYRCRISFFGFFLLLALVVMMTAPVYVYLTQFIPVLRSIRVIVRAGVMFILAASVLVGFGADLWLKAGIEEVKRFHRYVQRIVFAVFAFVLFSTLVAFLIKISGFIANTSGEYVPGSGRLAYLRSVAAAMASQFTNPGAGVLVPLALLSVLYLLSRLLHANKIGRDLFFTLLMILLVGDLYINSRQFDTTHDRSRVFPATAITENLRRLPPGRVLVAPSGIETNRKARDLTQEEKIIAPPNTLLPYQIPTVTGKDQLFPKAYREFCSLIEPQDHLSHVIFEKDYSRYFDALNVKYLLTYETAEVPASYRSLMKADGVALYENSNAMPRAFFVQRVLGENKATGMLTQLSQPDFDIKTAAIVQGVNFGAETCSVGNATIIEDRRNRVVIATANEGEGWLVLSDTFYPGWQARLDGKPTEVFTANHTMRAVRVPAGSHVLSFTFAPKVFTWSVILSLAAAACVFAALIGLGRKRYLFGAQEK